MKHSLVAFISASIMYSTVVSGLLEGGTVETYQTPVVKPIVLPIVVVITVSGIGGKITNLRTV